MKLTISNKLIILDSLSHYIEYLERVNKSVPDFYYETKEWFICTPWLRFLKKYHFQEKEEE